MTPAEKAKELVQRFIDAETLKDFKDMDMYLAKQCALICVDEIIKDRQSTTIGKTVHPRTEYWNEVKQEIEKL